MVELRGWLLDVYGDEDQGAVLWLASEDGQRYRLFQPFPVTFYAGGPFPRLRELWRFLQQQSTPVHPNRVKRRDLFAGLVDVLAIQAPGPIQGGRLFWTVRSRFPDLDYFDADVPIALRYGAGHSLFPLAHCQVTAGDDGQIQNINPLDSAWDMDPEWPDLRLLTIEPDVDPDHARPQALIVKYESERNRIPLKPLRFLLSRLQASLKRSDPDLILTRYGDTWVFPYLFEACQEAGIPQFNPNRDQGRLPHQQEENSYYTYGQVIYRGRQVRLFGRWHIDERNAVMYGHYGLNGVFEQARVTGLPVQEVARKSPGAGITAMQMQTALRQGVLIPYQKQQAEDFKSAAGLIQADRGGLVYQPLTGLHQDVAEIDFVSMYPSIMVHFNISPETVFSDEKQAGTVLAQAKMAGTVQYVPELGFPVDHSRTGLVPETLRPLLARRLAIKQRLARMDSRDCRYGPLKARSSALKWLLVVCFGYLGYKNARFGRIESHESVTAYGREALLRAKEAAEDLGYTVLHMYVDGLWVKQAGKRSVDDFQPLLEEVTTRTGLPIALEGIYRWVAFLPSRLDNRVPVANRYFGYFHDGRLKMRGIEARRHDAPPFVAQTQMEMLRRMAAVPAGRSPVECLPELVALLRLRLAQLRAGQIALERLLVSQTLSRSLEAYRVPSPVARAVAQLEAAGKGPMKPGQRVRFLYTLGENGVWAWDLPARPDPAMVDLERYEMLLLRAASAVTEAMGLEEEQLREWVAGYARQGRFYFTRETSWPAKAGVPTIQAWR